MARALRLGLTLSEEDAKGVLAEPGGLQRYATAEA